MKCIAALSEEHKIILRALDVVDHMALRVQNDQPVEAADVETILRFLRGFADDHHQTVEESALFPELMRTAATSEGPLRQMIFEHDQERSLVEGVEDALYTKKGTEFVEFANRLTQLLRIHIYKEDHILFKLAEDALSAEQDENVTTEMSKFQVDAHSMADLRRLEWKYLSRGSLRYA
jgi:hemerythrin-like domain-containing protein